LLSGSVENASERRGGAPYKYPNQKEVIRKMKKQLAMATVALMLMAVLLAPPVMASAGDKTINVGGNQLKVVEVT